MISIEHRLQIITCLLDLLKAEGLTLKSAEKDNIKEVILEHVTYLQAGIVDNIKPVEKK